MNPIPSSNFPYPGRILKVYPTGGKVFVAQARDPDGPDNRHKGRRNTVGRHPVLSAEEARQRATLIIARVKAGEEPALLPLPDYL